MSKKVIDGYSSSLDERIKPASVPQSITLHDTNEVTFLDPAEKTTKYCRGFHCNAQGTLSVVFAGSSTAVPLNLENRTYYPYSIKIFKSTGTVTIGNNDIIAMR